MSKNQAIQVAQNLANQNNLIMAVWCELSEFDNEQEWNYSSAEASDCLARTAINGTMVLVTPKN